jgi:predicted anti-sigma-YlaC factor YlaD
MTSRMRGMNRPCGDALVRIQPIRALLAVGLSLLSTGCSVRHLAVNALGDTLAGGSSVYAEDDDPELVGQAVPFALKTTEELLAESPRHTGLLLAAASGFAQYAYGWVQQDADFVEAQDLERATELRARARRLYLRARDYGLRGLEVDLPGLRERLRVDPTQALAATRQRHVPLLYWTGVAWFGAIALAKDEADLTADQHLAEVLVRRALALDESFERGAIHDVLIAWEGRGQVAGGSVAQARLHLERALTLSQGRRAWPLVTYAETVCVAQQDRRQFQELLERALAIDPAALRAAQLNNVISQRRARWLLRRADELFVE